MSNIGPDDRRERRDDEYDDYTPYDEEDDDSFFAPGGYLAWPGALSGWRGGDTDDRGVEDEYYDDESDGDEYRDAGYADSDEGGWLDEGIITLLIVVGAALFVFPEPATSGLGILLLAIGVLAWLVDLATPAT